MQELQCTGKTCNFEAVTAEQNKNQYIRDAFISGITSSHIRQRLLENNTLSLDEAFQQARALEQAQTQSASVSYKNSINAAINTEDRLVAASNNYNNKNNSLSKKASPTSSWKNEGKKETCFFCGKSQHPRTACPASDSECRNCNKISQSTGP